MGRLEVSERLDRGCCEVGCDHCLRPLERICLLFHVILIVLKKKQRLKGKYQEIDNIYNLDLYVCAHFRQ